VRALVASFASGNQVRFHEPSGSGYRFLSDIIVRLDPLNSQVAARLVPPLGQWRRMDTERQALMKQELQRILDTAGLSKGTFEMASRSIA
jgi:aminopeptidase N